MKTRQSVKLLFNDQVHRFYDFFPVISHNQAGWRDLEVSTNEEDSWLRKLQIKSTKWRAEFENEEIKDTAGTENARGGMHGEQSKDGRSLAIERFF